VGAIWVITEKDANGNAFEGSPKEYKILSISQSSETEQSITAVEHYNEKFDSIENNFVAYHEDVLIPSVRATDFVPPPVNLLASFIPATTGEGQNFKVEWIHPAALNTSTGDFYEYLAGYEVVHNIPDLRTPLRLEKSSTSILVNNAPEGDYIIKVRTINTLDNRSTSEVVTITIADSKALAGLQYPLGLPVGGTSNVGMSIDASGKFSLGTTRPGIKGSYIIVPQSTEGTVFKGTSINPETMYEQDCSGLANIAAGPATPSFDASHHYILMDASSVSDRLKLIKYNDTTYADPYWFDAGIGNDTSGLITLTGTITKAAGSNVIIGTGTSFNTQCQVGEVFKATNHNDLCRVIGIESDTSMTITKSVATAYASQSFQTTNIFIDTEEDIVISKVYRNNPFILIPLVSISADILDAGSIIAPGTIDDSIIGDNTITGASIKTGSISYGEIAANTIRGDNIYASTKIAVYQTDGAGDIVDSSYAALDGANENWRIYAGSESPQVAPFRVTSNGQVVAKNLQLYRDNGTIYFDSATGFSETAIAQIAGGVEKGRIYNLPATLTADLDTTDGTTYQKIEIEETTDVTFKMRVPVDNFSKHLSEEYFAQDIESSSLGLTIFAYNHGADYKRSDLQVTRDGGATFSSFDRALKGGEVIIVGIDGADQGYTKLTTVTGATKLDGTAYPASTTLTKSKQEFSFKAVAGQEFGFLVERAGESNITFKAGLTGRGTEEYSRDSTPYSYVAQDLNTNIQTWYYDGNSLGTNTSDLDTLTAGGVEYTRLLYKETVTGYANSQGTTVVYYSIRGADVTATVENTTAVPDLTATILTHIPTSIKARMFERTSLTDASPATIIDHWSTNNFTRVTSGTPTANQYKVTPNLDNAIAAGIIESDYSIDYPRTGTLGAVDGEGYITKSVTRTLTVGIYYFDIELEFTGGIAPIAEGSRLLEAIADSASRGFLVGDQGYGTTGLADGDITSIIAGDGIAGPDTLKGDATVSVDSTVVRTTGVQTITGAKTFSSDITTIAPASAGNSSQWNTGYAYSQIGHLPLSGGTLTGDLVGTGADFTNLKIGGTEVIDSNRNLKNISGLDVTLNIKINNSALVDANKKLFAGGVGAGAVEATLGTDGLAIAGSTVIDNAGNITTGTIDATGDITTTANMIASGGDSTQWNTAYGWGNHGSERSEEHTSELQSH
jgi:hypothetical protein